MPTLILELQISLADPEDLVVETAKIDNDTLTITDKDVSIVDSGHATVEITYTS